MARYFFNVYDGVTLPDEKGTELQDWAAARVHAIQFAGELMKDGAQLRAFGDDWRMEVVDEHGLLIFMLDFHVAAAPAIRGVCSEP